MALKIILFLFSTLGKFILLGLLIGTTIFTFVSLKDDDEEDDYEDYDE